MIVGIRKALEQRLNALAPTWPTAWENVLFEPTPNVSHQRVFLLPGSPLSLGTFTAIIQHLGLFQVDVVTTKEGGPNAGDARAVAIQSQFKRGTLLACDGAVQSLWVPDQPAIQGSSFDATWRTVHVTIPYNVLSAA
jgi:hypothetical protein